MNTKNKPHSEARDDLFHATTVWEHHLGRPWLFWTTVGDLVVQNNAIDGNERLQRHVWQRPRVVIASSGREDLCHCSSAAAPATASGRSGRGRRFCAVAAAPPGRHRRALALGLPEPGRHRRQLRGRPLWRRRSPVAWPRRRRRVPLDRLAAAAPMAWPARRDRHSGGLRAVVVADHHGLLADGEHVLPLSRRHGRPGRRRPRSPRAPPPRSRRAPRRRPPARAGPPRGPAGRPRRRRGRPPGSPVCRGLQPMFRRRSSW